tara:strand:- start:183 stop:2177 length:1995 start_codon:yes stop_codon:yes gene_type:complete
MDESSSFDLSAQNSALASVGAMGRAIKDHNQSVKDSFKTQFAIDRAEHSAAELKNEVKDFSETIGAAKGVYELKQQYNLARDTRLPGQSKLGRLFELQPEIASKNIRELKNRITQTLTGNVGEERSIGGLEDARGVAALNEELGTTSIPTGAEISDAVSGVASRAGTLGGEALGSIYGAGVRVAETGGHLMGQALTAASQARMGINQSQIKPEEESLDVKNYNSQFSELKSASDDLKSGNITTDEFRTRAASAYGFNDEAPQKNDFTRNTSFEQQRFKDVTQARGGMGEAAVEEHRVNMAVATQRDASDFQKAVEAHEAAKTSVLAVNNLRTNRAIEGRPDVEYGGKTSVPVRARQTPAPSATESAEPPAEPPANLPSRPALPEDDDILSGEGFKPGSIAESVFERQFDENVSYPGVLGKARAAEGAKGISATPPVEAEDDPDIPEVKGTMFDDNADAQTGQTFEGRGQNARDPSVIGEDSNTKDDADIPDVEGTFDDATKDASEVGEVGSDIKDVTASDRLAEGVLKFGSKAAAGLGVAGSVASLGSGLFTAGEDIFDKGYFSKLNPNQQLGNEAGIVGGALDAASLAVPLLAPFALGANIFSAVEKTIGEHKAGDPKLETDQVKEESQQEKGPGAVQTLSSVGLISSAPVDIHQSISGTSSF